MITSISLLDRYKIQTDSKGNFEVNGTKTSIKEVPFVRYKFNEYKTEDIEYIRSMKLLFIHSCHLAEITLKDNTIDELNIIKNIPDIAKFVYMDVTDDIVANGIEKYRSNLLQLLSTNIKIDRYMLRDKSTSLDNLTLLRLKKAVADIVGVSPNSIGICSSPLSFLEGNSCVTAIIARELMAEYVHSSKVALPSANHQGTNTCGCIRYEIVDKDIITKSEVTKKDTEKIVSTKEEKPKAKKVVGYSQW